MDSLLALLPFLIIFALFWLMLIRPARQQQRRVAAVQAQLAPGARIRTGAGLHATVVSVDGDTVQLEVAPGVVVTYARAAVTQVIDAPEAPTGMSIDASTQDPADRPADDPPGGVTGGPGDGPVDRPGDRPTA